MMGSTGRKKLRCKGPAMEREEYLGDAVYASFDGHQIWLRTGDGNNQRIALDPATYAALERYVARLRASLVSTDRGDGR